MNTTSLAKTTSVIISICLFLILGSIFSGWSNSGEIPAEEKIPYTVPAEKAQKWEDLKNLVRKDYDVCLEHCGYEQSCLDRCETVYKIRLDREYKLLLNGKEPAADK
jgi:hypothetical protein